MVGAAGFEPTLTESESGVLPLNYAPMRRVLYNAFCGFAIKIYDLLEKGPFCDIIAIMTVPITDIIKFHIARTNCHIDCLNYFAGLFGMAFPDHDMDKFTEPYQTGYAYHNYAAHHGGCTILPQQTELYTAVHDEHHRMQPHHVGYWENIQNIPDIVLTEMVCDWHSANFEQRDVLRRPDCCTIAEFFHDVMLPRGFSAHQVEFLSAAIDKIARTADYDAVRDIWARLEK